MQPQSPIHWLHGPLRQALREQVDEAPNGADAHDENGPDELGQEMGSIGFPEVQQAEDVEGDHEQDAEQDRNQHDRGRRSSMFRTLRRPQPTGPREPRIYGYNRRPAGFACE